MKLLSCLLLLLLGLAACQAPPATVSSEPTSIPTPPDNIAPTTDSILHFEGRIRSIIEDTAGHYWIGLEGVARYDGTTWTYFTTDQGLPDMQVRYLREDREGRIWAGTANGVAVYNGRGFEVVKPQPGRTLITEVPDHESFDHWLWFDAGNQNGALRWDGQQLEHLTFPVPPGYPEFDSTGFIPGYGYDRYAVYGFHRDRSGAMWFGTERAGLFRYDGRTFSPIHWEGPTGVIRAIYEDDQGRVWFGNNPHGLMYIEGGRVVDFSQDLGGAEEPAGALAIGQDSSGYLWIVPYQGGLWRYTPPEVRASLPSPAAAPLVQFTTEDGLPTNHLGSIYLDEAGTIWFGTDYGDIYGYDGGGFFPFGPDRP